jgi:hypothetical protein
MIFHKVEQNTLEWHKLRLGIPTASSFDKILTPAKRQRSSQAKHYMNRLVWEWITGEVDQDELYQNQWMQRGQEREDGAIAAYEMETETETEPGGFFTLDNGLAGASPDRLISADGILEVKCPLGSTQVGCAREGVEADHTCQIQGQLWITGRKWVDVWSYHPKLPLPPKRVLRDEDFIKDLAKAVNEFIEEMLRVRADMEREHGPFLRLGTDGAVNVEEFLRQEDVDAIYRSGRV